MHDRNGIPLKVGDEVFIPATIIETYGENGYCNIQVRTKFDMPGNGAPNNITLNAAQVHLRMGDSINPPPAPIPAEEPGTELPFEPAKDTAPAPVPTAEAPEGIAPAVNPPAEEA